MCLIIPQIGVLLPVIYNMYIIKSAAALNVLMENPKRADCDREAMDIFKAVF